MNRRRFMELLGISAAAGTVAYSFPTIIVPKNIITVPSFTLPSTERASFNPYIRCALPIGDYTLKDGDDMVYCSSDISVTLPPAQQSGRRIYIVPQKHVVTVQGQQCTEMVMAISNGKEWFLVGGKKLL